MSLRSFLRLPWWRSARQRQRPLNFHPVALDITKYYFHNICLTSFHLNVQGSLIDFPVQSMSPLPSRTASTYVVVTSVVTISEPLDTSVFFLLTARWLPNLFVNNTPFWPGSHDSKNFFISQVLRFTYENHNAYNSYWFWKEIVHPVSSANDKISSVIEGRTEGKVTRQLLREKKNRALWEEEGFRKKALFRNKETKISTFNKKYDVAPSLSTRLAVINLPYKWMRERIS